MTISLENAWKVVGGGCGAEVPERFTVAVEVETCPLCERDRYHFLKQHEILRVAGVLELVDGVLGELDLHTLAHIENAKAVRQCIDRDIANTAFLGKARLLLQTLREALRKAQCPS